ncbi:MAG: SDR family oxidoreductase [Planctomycetota bacterium]|jgi:dTDP-4-dehydrorhamnose reductase
MRILITGASGFLGTDVRAAALARDHAVVATARMTGDAAEPPPDDAAEWLPFDLVETGAAERLVAVARPAGVIHCAAMADIAPCRTVPFLAQRLNAEAAGELARAGAAVGAALVHVSTDQVFDGSRGGWTEADEPHPLHVYGETKLAGERAVAAAYPGAAIVRPGLITGRAPPGRRSSTSGLHAAFARGDTPRMFTDELRSPIAVADVARALLDLLERLASVDASAAGLFHCGGPETLSRHALALREADAAGLDASVIEATTRDAAGLAEERPADLSLDSSRLHALLGWTPRVLA